MAVPGLGDGSREVLAEAVTAFAPSVSYVPPSLFAAEHSQGQLLTT